MGKLKTHKATAKRYRVTGTGKIIRRKAGQDHFNARDTGKTGRYKKSVLVASQTLRKVMQKNLPNR